MNQACTGCGQSTDQVEAYLRATYIPNLPEYWRTHAFTYACCHHCPVEIHVHGERLTRFQPSMATAN